MVSRAILLYNRNCERRLNPCIASGFVVDQTTKAQKAMGGGDCTSEYPQGQYTMAGRRGVHIVQSCQQTQALKLPQDHLNELRHAIQRFNDRITLKNLRLSERYAKSEIHILLQLRFGNGQECVALFQGGNPSDGRNIGIAEIGWRSTRVT